MKTTKSSKKAKQLSATEFKERYYRGREEVEAANASINSRPVIHRRSGWFEQWNLTLQHAAKLIQKADAAGWETTLRPTRRKDLTTSGTPNSYTLRARPKPGPTLTAHRDYFPNRDSSNRLEMASEKSASTTSAAGWYVVEGETTVEAAPARRSSPAGKESSR